MQVLCDAEFDSMFEAVKADIPKMLAHRGDGEGLPSFVLTSESAATKRYMSEVELNEYLKAQDSTHDEPVQATAGWLVIVVRSTDGEYYRYGVRRPVAP